MTDAYIEARGRSLEEAFANAARALIDTVVHLEAVEGNQVAEFEVEGYDLQSLLYNWLEEVLLRFAIDRLVFHRFEVTIRRKADGYHLKGRGYGELLQVEKHRPKVEVKGVTYHLMEVVEAPEGVRLRFLLDL
jgi:SHS2 domain-containing protein